VTSRQMLCPTREYGLQGGRDTLLCQCGERGGVKAVQWQRSGGIAAARVSVTMTYGVSSSREPQRNQELACAERGSERLCIVIHVPPCRDVSCRATQAQLPDATGRDPRAWLSRRGCKTAVPG
jgi:hypothetical protein